MTKDEINILHLEDDAADAELIKSKLEAANITCCITQVQSRAEFEREIDEGLYDLILADYNLPAYDGISALRYTRKSQPDIPFIFVSGTIGEEPAIDGLIEGATDYVLKQKLSRLVPSVKRAISESVTIRKRRQAEEALRISEYRKTILNKVASIYLTTPDAEANEEVLSYLLELTNSEFGSLAYLEKNGDLLVPAFSMAILGPPRPPGEPAALPRSQWADGPLGEVVEERSPSLSVGPLNASIGRFQLPHVMAVPVLFGGQPIGLTCFGRSTNDYSEDELSILQEIVGFVSPILNARLQRDRHERIRKQAELDLIAAKEKAEENDRLKTAFLQNISHEIRTPMNAICGFSYLLSESDITDSQRNDYIKIIQASSNQLLSVITDVLTISSLETGQLNLNIQYVSPREVVLELLAIFRARATERGIRLISRQEQEEDDLVIETDKGKLIQILTNLITNAIKFTSEGSVEFGYERKANGDGTILEFFVRDTGIGIKKEAQEIIFERFRQADEGMMVEYGGTGLGLSISKGLVELLGGRIWIRSVYGEGSTFSFSIPCSSVAGMPKASDEGKKPSGSGKTALVVEDKESNFRFISEVLKSMEFKVIHAWNGREAIAVCESNPDIELVLMDIKMPFLDGYEAARRIKEIRPGLPVVAQTAYAMDHEKEKYRYVFDDYITKPIDRNDMMRKVLRF